MKRQELSYKVLSKTINKLLIESGIDVRKLDQEEKFSNLLQNKEDLQTFTGLDNFSSNMLLRVGDFLSLDLITGTNIITKVFKGIMNTPLSLLNLPL
jgi:hypothetical protein